MSSTGTVADKIIDPVADIVAAVRDPIVVGAAAGYIQASGTLTPARVVGFVVLGSAAACIIGVFFIFQ
uniref:Uncharacterized protein n=1 Tax=Panagrolaimus davidi TaxID=227884 RepID=A0A914Q2E5_9BILA